MSKYKAGDKVVLRKDLVDGEWYGDNTCWHAGMNYMKNKEYVVLEELYNDGDYRVDGWFVTDEMIECLYGHSNIENEHEIFLQALSKIAFHINEPLGEPENYKDTVYEFIDIAKTALDSHRDYTNNTK